jgi:hypothetical protein
VESRFGPFGDSVRVGAIQVHGLVTVLILRQDRCVVCVERTIGKEIVWLRLMELLWESIMWNLVSIFLETVLVSVQYRCTVCA